MTNTWAQAQCWPLAVKLTVERQPVRVKRGLRVRGHLAKLKTETHEIVFYVPAGFMNTCGQPIAQAMNYFKVPVENLMVLHDELDFPPGALRFKQGGGHGGHNGLRDIINKLGGKANFLRVRVGIGHPGHESRVSGFVLSRPPEVERKVIEAAFDELMHYESDLLAGQFEALMQFFHSQS